MIYWDRFDCPTSILVKFVTLYLSFLNCGWLAGKELSLSLYFSNEKKTTVEKLLPAIAFELYSSMAKALGL